MKKVSVIILAAGFGSRMKSEIPKALHKLGNITLIEHILQKAQNINAFEVICVISENMQEYFTKLPNIKVVVQKERKGTAHAVLVAKNTIENTEGTLLVLYADSPLIEEVDILQLIDIVESDKASLAVLGFNKNEKNSYGRIITDQKDNVIAIKEASCISHKEASDLSLCNSGVMALKLSKAWKLLEQIDNKNNKQEYYLTDIVKHANNASLICKFVLCEEQSVIGINNKIELSIAENIFQNKLRKKFMLNGVNLIDPNSVYFSFDTIIENDVTIYPNVYFLPKVIIKKGTTIYPNTVLEGVSIGENCSIGPFARLRPESEIKNNVRIGNFVEIKKSSIDEGTKVNHLTYLGDTEVGKNSNVGAGVVTCNYDGKIKSQTKIGNNAFIGSNTSLVAPINIQDDTTVAAGSTLVEDVEKASLAIARSRQTIIKNWKHKNK